MNAILLLGAAATALLAGIFAGQAQKLRTYINRDRRLTEINREVSHREHELRERMRARG